MPAATVVKRVKKFFGLLGVDEVHKCKAKGTGVGWALTVLNNACRYTVGLHRDVVWWLFDLDLLADASPVERGSTRVRLQR